VQREGHPLCRRGQSGARRGAHARYAADQPGALQSALERGQVYARGRHGDLPSAGAARGKRAARHRGRGVRHGHRHEPGISKAAVRALHAGDAQRQLRNPRHGAWACDCQKAVGSDGLRDHRTQQNRRGHNILPARGIYLCAGGHGGQAIGKQKPAA